MINEVFFSRFDWSLTSGLAGFSGRDTYWTTGLKVFLNRPFFGQGFSVTADLGLNGSIVGSLIAYGIIGIPFHFAHLIVLINALINKTIVNRQSYGICFITILLFLANLYHRPFYDHMLFVLNIFICFELTSKINNPTSSMFSSGKVIG